MDRFFVLFGKVVLVLGVLGIIAGGAFYLGRSMNTQPSNVQPIQTPQELSLSASPSLSAPTSTLTPIVKSKKTVQAGLSAKSGLNFTAYTIEVPEGWTVNDERDEKVPSDRLTITKGFYEVRIFQGATGGAMCLYPADPSFEGPQSVFDTFVNITSVDGVSLRRSGTDKVGPDGRRGFTVCQKASDGTFQQPTVFGHTSIMGPNAYDKLILEEIDAMIASLKKT